MEKDKQTIKLELTPEQRKVLSSNAKALSNGKLSIELFDEKSKIGEIKTAECAYYSDTCCV
jgi:hypothetical protein